MPRSAYFLPVFLLLLSAGTRAQSQSPSKPTAYSVVGRCHDYGSALGLKASVYAVIDGSQRKLGECIDVGKFEPETGTFNVLVPISATQLRLVMPGYRTVTIPIRFTPDIPAHARFAIYNWSEMTSLDSLPKPPDRNWRLATFFEIIDSLDVTYKVGNKDRPREGIAYAPFFHKRKNSDVVPLMPILSPGTCTITLLTEDGRFISDKKVTVGDGITFTSVRVTKPTEKGLANNAAPAAAPVVTAPTSTTLYFDQSSYDLRTQTKVTLDSIAQVLAGRPNLTATLTGYTDNVGRRDLNVALSEYRARLVANYLRQHNVPDSQIVISGQGPAPGAAAGDADSTKAKSRRVVVQVEAK